MSLDLIIGPMFSGKTTELIRRLHTLYSIGKKCIYVNSSLDTREEKDYSSHNKTISTLGGIASAKMSQLNIEELVQFDIIGIDESQLFSYKFKDVVIKLVEEHGKHVIVSGLNGDFKREKFGEILDLIPLCDNVTKLFPYCITCSHTRSAFSYDDIGVSNS